MTRANYDYVKVGMPVSTLQSRVGQPYAVHAKGDGTEEYEYIEKMESSDSWQLENHYFIIIQDGEVVGKYTTTERRPAYDSSTTRSK